PSAGPRGWGCRRRGGGRATSRGWPRRPPGAGRRRAAPTGRQRRPGPAPPARPSEGGRGRRGRPAGRRRGRSRGRPPAPGRGRRRATTGRARRSRWRGGRGAGRAGPGGGTHATGPRRPTLPPPRGKGRSRGTSCPRRAGCRRPGGPLARRCAVSRFGAPDLMETVEVYVTARADSRGLLPMGGGPAVEGPTSRKRERRPWFPPGDNKKRGGREAPPRLAAVTGEGSAKEHARGGPRRGEPRPDRLDRRSVVAVLRRGPRRGGVRRVGATSWPDGPRRLPPR